MDFYIKLLSIKKLENNANNFLDIMKRQIDNLKDLLYNFETKAKNISDLLNEELIIIRDFNFNDDRKDINLNTINTRNNFGASMMIPKYPSKIDKSMLSNNDLKSSRISYNNNFGRINIRTLLSPDKKKRDISNIMEKQRIERRETSHRYTEGGEATIEEEDNSLYYTIETKTNNLFCYNIANHQINKIQVDLSKFALKKFESYNSIMNYQGKFYLSGGYTTGSLFSYYNKNNNEFINLADMISKHSYHSMIGVGNYIFAISGYKSKKIEKYNINLNQWEKISPLKHARSYPSCVCIDDKLLFIFGGLIELNEGENSCHSIEKLDITNNKSICEEIEINSDIPFTYYFGVIQLNNNKVLLLGGKLDTNDESIDDVYSFSFDSQSLSLEEGLKLPSRDEFQGRQFIYLDEGKYGQFSSIYSDCFYIYNDKDKNFEVIKYHTD